MTHKTTAELSRAYPTDAGLDIKSSEDTIVPAYTSLLVHTGLHVAIKEGFVGILKSRSGLAMKHGIDVAAGVIDFDIALWSWFGSPFDRHLPALE